MALCQGVLRGTIWPYVRVFYEVPYGPMSGCSMRYYGPMSGCSMRYYMALCQGVL